MTAPIIDRDAIIEKAARAEWVACWPKVPWSDDAAGEWLRITAAAIEPIADDLLAPIEAALEAPLPHITGVGATAAASLVRVDAARRAIAAIREAVRA